MRVVGNVSSVAKLQVIVTLVALLIAAHGPTAAATKASQTLPYSVGVPESSYEYIQVGADAPATTLTLLVSSNVSVSTALMTLSQYDSFGNYTTDLSTSVFLHNGTSAQTTLHLSEGIYYLLFYAYDGNANVSYNEVTYPVEPYVYIPLTPPEPTGVASFGIYNQSGTAVPYQVSSDEVVGIANIKALQAYNATAASASSNLSGATLQLNSVLLVNEQGGKQQVYWAQNTPDFVTSASQVAFGDNLWNFSVSGYMSNTTVTSPSGGIVSSAGPGLEGDYYGWEASNMTYNFPLVLALLMSETVTPGQGILVQMGAQVLENGTGPVSGVTWFDNVTIHDPTVESASFFVSGNQTVAGGYFYDTELVFGGENNGEETDFTQMAASLGLFYENSTTGVLDAYPSVYSFGGDTAESADNLQVSTPVDGFAAVTTGTPDYVYLGTLSRTLSLPLTTAEVVGNSSLSTTSTSSVHSSTTSSQSSSTTQSTTSAQSTSSTQSTSSASSSSSATTSSASASSVALLPSVLLTLLFTGFVLAVAVLGSGLRSRRRPSAW